MRKKFLYIGIILFVLGIIVGILSTSLALPSTFSNPIEGQILVNASSLGYVPITLNQTGIVILFFNSSSPVDLYFANASAFGRISGAGISGGASRNEAINLEGNGVYEVYENSTNGVFPYAYQGFAAPKYLVNSSTVLQSGTYYAIFANGGSGAAAIIARMLPASLTTINSEFQGFALYGAATIVLVVVGLGMVVLSFFLKNKPKAEQGGMEEEVKKEYDRIDKKGKKQ